MFIVEISSLFSSTTLFALQLTLVVAGFATLIALIFGLILSYFLNKRSFPGKDWLDAACTLPLVMPPTVLGYYLIVLIGRNSFLGGWLYDTFGISLMFTWQGAVIAATVVAFPLIFTSTRAALEGVDKDMEDAARILGASEIEVFFRISLPLAFRSILAGTMLAFARALGEFGATLMVAGNLPGRTQTLSLAVYSAVQAGEDSLANQLVCVISVLCVIILVTTSKLLKPRT